MLKQLDGFVDCGKCPVVSMCNYHDIRLSRDLGRYEGRLIEDEMEIEKLNDLIEEMNRLIKRCPLVKLLEQYEARAGVKAS